VVDKHTVGEVADLALHNCVGAHSLLIKRTLKFAQTATFARALAASVFFDASLIVSGLLNQFLCRTVPTDNSTESQLAVFDGGHIQINSVCHYGIVCYDLFAAKLRQ